MPELVALATAVHRSFVAAMEEFRAEGRGGPDDHSMIGREFREYRGRDDVRRPDSPRYVSLG